MSLSRLQEKFQQVDTISTDVLVEQGLKFFYLLVMERANCTMLWL
ncbi:MAG: hypothetical protein WBW48_23360 [Anaerolineae bacterium]